MLRLALEAAAVAVLVSRWIASGLRRQRRHQQQLSVMVEQYLGLVRAITAEAGDTSVLAWRDVTEAPPASMDVTKLQPGESTKYSDTRGSIYRFKVAEGTLLNMYFTKAGVRRSGDLHNCTQYDVVLKGRCRLRMLDPHTGRETVREYVENDFIVIPARTPHMFEFLEDNCLLEWWADEFKAWYYTPYRSVIDRALPLADTARADFSIDVAEQRRGAPGGAGVAVLAQ
uniref:Uncharacterized protein n=1 Tax=Chlamydomonas euryale TaxID=1486919 RepID=A0A7R9VL35_9CHLO|mmetsp:Transcript_38034/g.112593  ORF Transcript_38034/g.112593 Transcript_38034/m.112593 type:complete len:228 (+) Transcript_38034:251-934(+)